MTKPNYMLCLLPPSMRSKLSAWLAPGHFFRNVAILLTGTVIAQAVGILISPVLTRLYPVTEFGVYALFMASTAIVGTLAGARYEMAIVVPEKDQDGMTLVVLTTMIGLILMGLLLVLVLVAHSAVSSFLGMSELGIWLFALPGFVFLSVCTVAFRYWFNRRKMYSQMASNAVWRALLTAVFTVVFGYFGMAETGLISGLLLGQTFTTVCFAYQLWRLDKALVRDVRWESVRGAARKYINFPRYLIPSAFVESFSSQLPTFCLAAFYGQSTVGLFALASRVVNAPFGLVSASVGDVFRQQASEEYARSGNCRPLFRKCTLHLLSISIVPFGVLFLIAPAGFAWVFGPQWSQAGTYVQLMTVMFLVRFVTSPLSVMFYVAEKQKWDLVLQSILLTVMAVTFYIIGQRKASPEAGILAYSIIYTAKYCVEYCLSFAFTVRRQHDSAGRSGAISI